jgi:uncharacterized protein (TIGR03086 family)
MSVEERLALHCKAVEDSATIVARATQADLVRATPCAGWSLDMLLRHMNVQHHGFAAACRGTASMEAWAVRTDDHDPIAAHRAAADDVLDAFAAFADPSLADRLVTLHEISATLSFSLSQVIGMHTIDYVVHGWDVARTLGLPYTPDQDVANAALRVAERIPNGDERLQPGAAFAPGWRIDGDASVLDRILTLVGRSPSWPN